VSVNAGMVPTGHHLTRCLLFILSNHQTTQTN